MTTASQEPHRVVIVGAGLSATMLRRQSAPADTANAPPET